MAQISCTFNREEYSTIQPWPSSREARIQGCVCPDQDYPPARGLVYFETDCAVHVLVKVGTN